MTIAVRALLHRIRPPGGVGEVERAAPLAHALPRVPERRSAQANRLPAHALGFPVSLCTLLAAERRTRTRDLKNKNPRVQARGGKEGKEEEGDVLSVRMKVVERVVTVGAMPCCLLSSHPHSL